MNKIKYILDGVVSHPRKQITDDNSGVQYSFDFGGSRTRLLELAVSNLEFVGEDYFRIKNWLNTKGYYLGMPMDIEYSQLDIEKYLLDFSAESFREKEGFSYTVPLRKFEGTDNFFDNAMGVSFARLPWQPADFVDIDYVIVPEAQFSYFISLAIATFGLAREFANSIQEIQEGIADVVKASTPVGFPPVPDWGAIIVAIIKLAARIAYAIFIIIALIKLAIEILNLIFPKIRQFKGVGVKRLIERTAEKYDLVLNSTLLDSLEPLTILPAPLRKKEPSWFTELFFPATLAFTYGYPSPKDVVKSPGQVIKVVEDVFNAESVVRNGELVIENEEFFIQNAATNIDLAYNIQESIDNSKGNNADEIFKRIVIDYPTDPMDFNTFDDTKDSTNEQSSEIINSPGASYELIKNLDFRTTTFARGTRKGKLTFVEKVAKTFAEGIDLFTGSDLASIIEDRKNVLQLETQYPSVTKWLWMNGSRLHEDQNQFIGAKALEAFHIPRQIENNQKDTVEKMPWASTKEELFDLLDNNYVNLDNGKVAKVLRGTWSEETHIALIDHEVKRASVNEETIEINPG
jgi:hypothetical protein